MYPRTRQQCVAHGEYSLELCFARPLRRTNAGSNLLADTKPFWVWSSGAAGHRQHVVGGGHAKPRRPRVCGSPDVAFDGIELRRELAAVGSLHVRMGPGGAGPAGRKHGLVFPQLVDEIPGGGSGARGVVLGILGE